MVNSHGRFLWYELTTTDTEAAKAFYARVVGWGTQAASTPGMTYSLFTVGEDPVSGLMDLPAAARTMGIKPHWIGYVGVGDVDATAELIKRLGGAVHVPPTDVPNIGRLSVVADPQTATLALVKWLQPGEQQTAELGKPGHVGWHELLAADRAKAFAFYRELFGWRRVVTEMDPIGTYQLFSAGGQTIGGMFTKPPMMPMPFWLYYFNVGDVDAAAQRVETGGGQILEGPVAVPSGGRVVRCMDPQGAMFALEERRGRGAVGYFERVPSRDSTDARGRRWSW